MAHVESMLFSKDGMQNNRSCAPRRAACKTRGEGGGYSPQPTNAGGGKMWCSWGGVERVGAEALRKNIAGEG